MERANLKIVKIKGGAGNQLFQYSFAKWLQATGANVKLDCFCSNGCSNKTCIPIFDKLCVSLAEASQDDIDKVCVFPKRYPLLTFKYKLNTFFEKIFNKRYYFESKRAYVDLTDIQQKYTYFDGYWQSWKYPYFCKEVLIRELRLKNNLSDKSAQIIKRTKTENSVFIGVRKGDYVSSRSARNRYGSFSNEYYLNAMKYIAERLSNPIFYVFSDDIEWCKQHLDFGSFNVVYREKKDQTSDVEELFIMASCKNAIIVNSTFQWWGAFLQTNTDKIVICPYEWFSDGSKIDICPPEWIKLKRNGEFN